MPFSLVECHDARPDLVNDLNDMLIRLQKIGDPHVTFIEDGWYAELEMRMSHQGVRGSVSSSFDHPTPLAAVQTLVYRMDHAHPGLWESTL